jgi:hypothetical protein
MILFEKIFHLVNRAKFRRIHHQISVTERPAMRPQFGLSSTKFDSAKHKTGF